MKAKFAVILAVLLALTLLAGACAPLPATPEEELPSQEAASLPDRDGYYYDVENVVLYLETYRELPPNYITKDEARELGWSGGSVEELLEGAAIGGDRFGNYEGLLPDAEGRSFYECDIDTHGLGSRGSRRLVYSNDGLYYYTSDHYGSFHEVTVDGGVSSVCRKSPDGLFPTRGTSLSEKALGLFRKGERAGKFL